MPLHCHIHDTIDISAASVLATAHAGVDAADSAMASMNGLTSQPNFGSIVEELAGDSRGPGVGPRRALDARPLLGGRALSLPAVRKRGLV